MFFSSIFAGAKFLPIDFPLSNKGQKKSLNFLITVVLVVLALVILVPLFIDFSGFGSEMTCKTLCTMDPDVGGWDWLNPANLPKGALGSLLGYFRGNLKCPDCKTMEKDMNDFEKGEVMEISIKHDEGKPIFSGKLETWWFDSAGDKETPCFIRLEREKVEDKGILESVWDTITSKIKMIAIIAASVAVGIIAAIGTGPGGIVAGAATFGALTAATSAGDYVGTNVARWLKGDEGTGGQVAEIKDLDQMKGLVEELSNGQIKAIESWRSAGVGCTEINGEGTCNGGVNIESYGGNLECYWNGSDCKNLPEGGFDKIDDLRQSTYKDCVEQVKGKDYSQVTVDEFRGEVEDIEDFVDLEFCVIKKESNVDPNDFKPFRDYVREKIEHAQEKNFLDSAVLRQKEGECLGSFLFQDADNPCSTAACPDKIPSWMCKIYTKKFSYDTQLGDNCKDGDPYCNLALPSYSSEELKEEGAKKFAKGREGVYYWMPRGDLLCEPGEGWVLCNAGPHTEKKYTFEVEGTEITLKCSDYTWNTTEGPQIGEEGQPGTV